MKILLSSLAAVLFAQLGVASPLYQGPFETNPDGATRKAALVYLPNDYAKQAQWPLVILLHAYTSTAHWEDRYLGLSSRVSSRGFILLAPQGTTDPNGDTFWNSTDYCCDFYHSHVDDVAYLTDLIKKVQAQYHVDARRIYAYGHSNGGFMVNRLACDHGEIFAAMASLAGVGFKDPALCHSKEPVSLLHIHAENDHRIEYGGTSRYPGALETIGQWTARDGCQGNARKGESLDLTRSIPGVDTTTQYWDGCRAGTEVALWTIKSYEAPHHNPHVPAFNPDATDHVIDFLFAHHR